MDSKWRQTIVDRLRERNKRENDSFHDIVTSNNRLSEKTNQLKAENLQLSFENEKLRSSGFTGDTASSSRIQALEKKLLAQQEELTEMHKRKGDNSQLIIDMNTKVVDFQKQLESKSNSLIEQIKVNNSLKAEVQMLTTSIQELKLLNTTLRDEHSALHLLHCMLEEKLRKTQMENNQLVERLVLFKAKDAEKMNEENETFLKKKSDKMKRDLDEACREGNRRSASPIINEFHGSMAAAGMPLFGDELPNKAQLQFDAHDGDVNAVSWSPVERVVATGGSDRKVKLWDVGKHNTCEPRGTLVGSNQAINSLHFDSTGSLILGTSNDFASRVWSVSDHRLRHTLTGHSGKVMAAKFVGESQKIVTGSHDRTLKIWDLRSRSCVETKFAGSSCNDLVTTDGSGSTIISGHFDKKVRFWDTRTDCSSNDITMQGKVTSLDLSKDCNYLVCCVRDDTIKIIDLRTNQIVTTLSDENYKVACDFARIAFSSDSMHVAAGSADGSIFLWHSTGKLETVLKEHNAAVQAVSFHPFSSILASVDRAKKCTIWTHI